MRAIDLRILIEDDGKITVVSQGEAEMKKAKCRKIYDDYMEWGRTQGGRGGRPWADFHNTVVGLRLTWWLDTLDAWEKNIDDLKPVHFEEAVPKIPGRNGCPPSSKTRREYIGVAKAFVRWAMDRDYCTQNPLKIIRLPDAENEKDFRALTIDEYRAIMAVAPPSRRLLYELSVYSGLRRKEMFSLTSMNIDAKNHCLRVCSNETKNRKKALLPVPASLIEQLTFRARNFPDGTPIFQDMDPEELTKDFVKDMACADVARETPEGVASLTSLRKTRSTVLQHLGAGIVEVQRLMRHSSPDVTARHYTTITNQEARDRVAQLEATLGPQVMVPAVGFEPKPLCERSVFIVQHQAEQDVTVNSLKIEQLARMTSVWFSLSAECREKIMLLAGFDGPATSETRS